MYDPSRHHRQSIRARGYNYSNPGFYFITICTQNRTRYFGQIDKDNIILNDAGRMVNDVWEEIPQRFNNVAIDKYVLMPDHFHAIIHILPQISVGQPLVGCQNNTNGEHDSETGCQNNTNGEHDSETGCQNNTNGKHDSKTGCQNIMDGEYDLKTVCQNIETDGYEDLTTRENREPTRDFPPVSPTPSLFDIVGAFKSISTNKYIDGVKQNNWQSFHKKLWQFQYHDRIIRDVNHLFATQNYIMNHPN